MPEFSFAERFGYAEEDDEQQAPLTEEPTAAAQPPPEPEPQAAATFGEAFGYEDRPAQPDETGFTSFAEKFGYAEEPEAEPAAEPELEPDPSFWDLLSKSYYDSRARGIVADQAAVAEDIKDMREGKALRSRDPGGPLGMSGRDISRQIQSGTPEGRAKLESEYLDRMEDRLETAAKLRKKGEEIKLSPHVERFLTGEGGGTMTEDFFAEGIPGALEIIWEVGLSSGYASGKSIVAGTAGGIAGGLTTGSPVGAAAGFMAGSGMVSAREEWAASVAQGMLEAGLDPTDPESFVKIVSDEKKMAEIISKANKRAIIIGGVDAIAGGVAGAKLVSKPVLNALAQTGAQAAFGGGGEALAQAATDGKLNPREIAAEAIGELVTAPIEVGGAVLARKTGEETTDAEDDGGGGAVDAIDTEQQALAELELVRREAEKAALQEGLDPLQAAMVADQAVAEATVQVQDRYAKMAADMTEKDEIEAALADELEREAIYREKAQAYERDVQAAAEAQKAEIDTAMEKEAAFEQAETEQAAQREAETREAEYQRELQKGEGVQAIEEAGVEAKPATVTMAEAAPELANLAARRKKAAAQKESKPVEKEGKPAPKVPLLEDKRPTTIVVDSVGEARPMTAKEVDLQIRKRWTALKENQIEMELPDGQMVQPEIPVRVNEMDLLIETPKNTERKGKRKDGSEWSMTMKDAHYGKIKGARGADNEMLDVYVGEQDLRPKGMKVWVVDQYREDGTFDEHKVMLGFANQLDATRTYERNNHGNMRRGAVTEMTLEEFKKWAFNGKIKNKPLGDQAPIQFGTQEDVEAVAERQERKGRKRPKILYKKADEKIEVVEKDNQIFFRAHTEDQGPVGSINIEYNESLGKYQVRGAGLISAGRGRGIGQQLIYEAVKYAAQKGKELVSDNSVTVAQLRAYEALRREGLLVVEYNAPATVREALENKAPTFSVVMDVPVIRRMFIPETNEEIQLRKGDEGKPRFDYHEVVEQTVALLLDFMKGISPDQVHVLPDPQDAPMEIFAELSRTGNLDARGAHVAETGDIYIFTGNHNTASEAISTFLHEAVGHFGLRTVLGDQLPNLLDEVWANGNQQSIRQIAERYGLDVENVSERREATEEYIAHLAETKPDSTLLRRIIDNIRQFLRNAGLLESWTDNDIHSLLKDVRRELRHKPLEKITLGEEGVTADVALRRHDKRTAAVERLKNCVS